MRFATAAATALCFATLAACGQDADTQASQAEAPAPAAEAPALEAEIVPAQADAMSTPAPDDAPVIDLSAIDPDAGVLGDPDAPVEIIEYASVTCPHCAAFHEDMFPHIKAEWIDTGKAKLVMRPLPTAPVDLAMVGFLLARCSGPDHYFTVLDDLFDTQETLFSTNGEAELRAYYEGIAATNGVDPDRVPACLSDQDGIDQINAAVMAADEHGVTGTPSFVVNGEPVDRSLIQTEDGWDALLQAALDAETADQ